MATIQPHAKNRPTIIAIIQPVCPRRAERTIPQMVSASAAMTRAIDATTSESSIVDHSTPCKRHYADGSVPTTDTKLTHSPGPPPRFCVSPSLRPAATDLI